MPGEALHEIRVMFPKECRRLGRKRTRTRMTPRKKIWSV